MGQDNIGSRFYFSDEQLKNTPSRKLGMPTEQEMRSRNQGISLIHRIAKQLHIKSLVISSAIVYFQRFYMFQPFQKYNLHEMALTCLFLATKNEENYVPAELLVKISYYCQHEKRLDNTDHEKDGFNVANCKIMNKMMDQMVYNENILLMTIGFSLSVVHPHTVIIQAHQNGLIDKDLGRLACTVATNFFKYTMLCLRYEPAFLACVCIHLAAEHLKSQVIKRENMKIWCARVNKQVCHEDVLKVAKKNRHYSMLDMMKEENNKPSSPDSAYSSAGSSPDESNNDSDGRSPDQETKSCQEKFSHLKCSSQPSSTEAKPNIVKRQNSAEANSNVKRPVEVKPNTVKRPNSAEAMSSVPARKKHKPITYNNEQAYPNNDHSNSVPNGQLKSDVNSNCDLTVKKVHTPIQAPKPIELPKLCVAETISNERRQHQSTHQSIVNLLMKQINNPNSDRQNLIKDEPSSPDPGPGSTQIQAQDTQI